MFRLAFAVLIPLTFSIINSLHAQEFGSQRLKLADADVSSLYSIGLFSSTDNLHLQKEGDDEPDLEFKDSTNLKSTRCVSFLQLGELDTYYRRLTFLEIAWTGGTEQSILNIDLYKGDEKIITFPDIANVGHYKLKVPYAAKPGKDYRLRITDNQNKDQIVFSQPFEVIRKFPLALKVMPFVLIGMGIMIAKSCDPRAAQ